MRCDPRRRPGLSASKPEPHAPAPPGNRPVHSSTPARAPLPGSAAARSLLGFGRGGLTMPSPSRARRRSRPAHGPGERSAPRPGPCAGRNGVSWITAIRRWVCAGHGTPCRSGMLAQNVRLAARTLPNSRTGGTLATVLPGSRTLLLSDTGSHEAVPAFHARASRNAGLGRYVATHLVIANLAHRRVVDRSADGPSARKDPLCVGGVYAQPVEAGPIRGPASIPRGSTRRERVRPPCRQERNRRGYRRGWRRERRPWSRAFT